MKVVKIFFCDLHDSIISIFGDFQIVKTLVLANFNACKMQNFYPLAGSIFWIQSCKLDIRHQKIIHSGVGVVVVHYIHISSLYEIHKIGRCIHIHMQWRRFEHPLDQ